MMMRRSYIFISLKMYNDIKDNTHMCVSSTMIFKKILGDVKVIKIVIIYIWIYNKTKKKNNDDDHRLPRSEAAHTITFKKNL